MNRWHELSERTSPAPILLCRKYFISFPFDIPGERSNRPFHNSGKILTFITPPPFSALFFHRFCYQTPPPFFPPRFLKAIQKEGRRTTTRLQSSGGEGRNSHCAPLPPPPLFSHTRELFLRGGEGSQSMCVRESLYIRECRFGGIFPSPPFFLPFAPHMACRSSSTIARRCFGMSALALPPPPSPPSPLPPHLSYLPGGAAAGFALEPSNQAGSLVQGKVC